MKKEKNNAAANAADAANAAAENQVENNAVENNAVENEEGKVINENLLAAITTASDGLKGTTIGDGTLAGAAETIRGNGDRRYFDPSLSQYKEGLILNFDPDYARVKEVPVGTAGNTATVVTIPAGMFIPGQKPVYDKVFNAYVSTFRKRIQVTDDHGEPVLDANMTPRVVTGDRNKVWEEMASYTSESQALAALSGRQFKCVKIMRDFGPAKFKDGAPTGHRLTSLPLFEEI